MQDTVVKLRREGRRWVARGVEYGWMSIDMLIAKGFLDPEDAEDDRSVGAAISRMLAHSAEQWMRDSRG